MKPLTQPFEPIKGIKGLTFLVSFQMGRQNITLREIHQSLIMLPPEKMELWAHSTYPFAFQMVFSIEPKVFWTLMPPLNDFSKTYSWWSHCELIASSEEFYKALDFVIQSPVKVGLADHWLNWEGTYLNPNYP